jgi:hypothetical protein
VCALRVVGNLRKDVRLSIEPFGSFRDLTPSGSSSLNSSILRHIMISRLLGKLFTKQSRRSRSLRPANGRRLALESLESRQMLTLIGISPGYPLTAFDTTGHFQYSAANETFDMTAAPFAILPSATSTPVFVSTPRNVEIHILLNNSGSLLGGNGTSFGTDDFTMSGTVVLNGTTYSGTLLNGSVLQFGYQYNSGINTSQFDFRFAVPSGSAGGALASFYAGMDIGVTMASENSNTFTGSFATDFSGGAKGNVGPINPLPVSIYGYKFDDVSDTGVDNNDPRLNGWTFNLYAGTDTTVAPIETDTTTVNPNNGDQGEYSFTGLAPGTYTVLEVPNQQVGWTQTTANTAGVTVTLTSGQTAVAYSGEEGTPVAVNSEVVTPLLAFGNFKPSELVIGMDKSTLTPKNVFVVDPATGNVNATITPPYGNSFAGGVRVATGDLTGNIYDEIATAPGRTGAPVINFYDQFGNALPIEDQNGNVMSALTAYPSSVNGGLEIAIADLYGNGLGDIIVVPSWGPAEVRVFQNLGPDPVTGYLRFNTTPVMDFLAFPSSFVGGATVTASSLGATGSGVPQIIVGSNAGMNTTVEVFNFNPGSSTSPPSLATPVATFYPYSTASRTFTGGVSLAVARLTAAPMDSIVTGAGTGGGSLVNVWGWNAATNSFSGLLGAGVAAFPGSNLPINVATLVNNVDNSLGTSVNVASAILAVQDAGGTTGQVNQLDITSTAPLTLTAPFALPPNSLGTLPPWAGPDTLAVINYVEPGTPLVPALRTTAKPVSQPTAKPAAIATTTSTTKPTTTATTTTAATTSTTKPATTSTTTATTSTTKPATTTTTSAAASTTKPATTTTTTTKPATTAATPVAATAAKPAAAATGTAATKAAVAAVTVVTKSAAAVVSTTNNKNTTTVTKPATTTAATAGK